MSLYKVTDRDARSGRALFLFHGYRLSPLYYRNFHWGLPADALRLGTNVVQSNASPAWSDYFPSNWHWLHVPANITYALFGKTNMDESARRIASWQDQACALSSTHPQRVPAIDNGGEELAQNNPLTSGVSRLSMLRAWIVFTLGALIFPLSLALPLESTQNR